MKIEQQDWIAGEGWQKESAISPDGKASLALVFGAREVLGDGTKMSDVRARYPGTHLMGCTASGGIFGFLGKMNRAQTA